MKLLHHLGSGEYTLAIVADAFQNAFEEKKEKAYTLCSGKLPASKTVQMFLADE